MRREVSISGSRDERIAVVARLQRGRIARRQLLAIKVSPASIAWLVARGRLFPTLRCVFCVGHTASIELGAETDALLSVREGAALSHWSGAAMWGLWSRGGPEVDVTVDHDAPAAVNAGVRVHRSRMLQSGDIRLRHGLPVTSPARTLLDIAPQSTERQLELAFERAITGRVMREADVADVLERAGGHRGRKRLAALLEYWAGGSTLTWSEAEERLRALLRSARLPQPQSNVKVAGHTVDFFWPEQRFVLEVDGYRFHSGRRAFENDRCRDQDLRRAQVDVMRVTRRQIESDAYGIVAGVAATLARRDQSAA
ncbi:MAG TPA: DUF559 domain-containing protein [Solirubrobacteraceae bacterium]